MSAAELAIASPLLEASMEGAHGVLLSISGGSDLGIFEINEAASMVADAAHLEANIIFGAIIDDALGDEVRVTVIAAGFDGGAPKHKPVEQQRREQGAERPPAPLPPAGSTTPTVTSRYGPPANAGVRGGSVRRRQRRPRPADGRAGRRARRPGLPQGVTVRRIVTSRSGGVSTGPYASFNLGDHVGDDPAAVAANRRPAGRRGRAGAGPPDLDGADPRRDRAGRRRAADRRRWRRPTGW